MGLVAFVRFTAPLGGTRLLDVFDLIPPLEVLDTLPADVPERVRAEFHRVPALDTYYRENGDYAESARWIAGAGDLGDLPIVVLTRDLGDGADPFDALDAELQARLAELSSRGVVRGIPGSLHSSTVLEEKHAGIVSDTIIEMVQSVRRSGATRVPRAAP